MSVQLLKHHVLRCIHCGKIQTCSARERAKCLSCNRSWAISQEGSTVGVLDSFWLPHQAGKCAQDWKMKLEIQTAVACF